MNTKTLWRGTESKNKHNNAISVCNKIYNSTECYTTIYVTSNNANCTYQVLGAFANLRKALLVSSYLIITCLIHSSCIYLYWQRKIKDSLFPGIKSNRCLKTASCLTATLYSIFQSNLIVPFHHILSCYTILFITRTVLTVLRIPPEAPCYVIFSISVFVSCMLFGSQK